MIQLTTRCITVYYKTLLYNRGTHGWIEKFLYYNYKDNHNDYDNAMTKHSTLAKVGIVG